MALLIYTNHTLSFSLFTWPDTSSHRTALIPSRFFLLSSTSILFTTTNSPDSGRRPHYLPPIRRAPPIRDQHGQRREKTARVARGFVVFGVGSEFTPLFNEMVGEFYGRS